MDRKLKVLYYRGVRNTTQFFHKKSNQLKELTYRGVSYISATPEHIASHATKTYRGVAY